MEHWWLTPRLPSKLSPRPPLVSFEHRASPARLGRHIPDHFRHMTLDGPVAEHRCEQPWIGIRSGVQTHWRHGNRQLLCTAHRVDGFSQTGRVCCLFSNSSAWKQPPRRALLFRMPLSFGQGIYGFLQEMPLKSEALANSYEI